MVLIALLLVAAPSSEAQALGVRLARINGGIIAAIPFVARQQTEELVAAHPELGAPEKETLRAIGAETARMDQEKLIQAVGQAYAESLSTDDLRALVTAAESPASAHLRAALPTVMRVIGQSIGHIDYKGETMAAFCRKTGKACPGK